MKKNRILIALIIILGMFFINTKSANAEEIETYCRYKYSFALNPITGIWESIWNSGFSSGKFVNATVDIVDNNGSAKGTMTKSSELFATFEFNFDSNTFYNNGEFKCPRLLYADKDGSTIKLYSELSGRSYAFARVNGPATREIDPTNIDISDVTCTGVLGGFKNELEGILKIIRIVAPVLVIFLGSYEYIAAIFSKDADNVKKANSRLMKRLLLIAVLFFLPIILNLLLGIINESYTSCLY